VPTYEYECTACARRFEVVQRFSDASLTTCDVCGGELRKVFSSVGVVFKGSGFYKTDSRGATSGAAPAKPVATEKAAEPSSTPTTSTSSGTPAAATTD
jgi:putative FmdB family regulatory protein